MLSRESLPIKTYADTNDIGVKKLTPVLHGLTEYVDRRTGYDSLIPEESAQRRNRRILITNARCAMNSQPNQSEHAPEPTARRSETEHRGIIDSIPVTADQSPKLSARSDDYDQRADLHSLNCMIGVPMEIGRFLPLAVAIITA